MIIETNKMYTASTGIGNLRRGYTIFYSNNYLNEISPEQQLSIFNELFSR